MPTLTIASLNERKIHVAPDQPTVLAALHAARVDWMHACGGKGRCTTCKMIIVTGGEQLPPLNEHELRMQRLGRLAEGERLACQCPPTADVTFRVAEDNKLPHLEYTD